MFLVRDTHEDRVEKIRKLADIDIVVGVIMASVYFEWACRRCILALGSSPTKIIRDKYLKKATFRRYPEIWNKEVYPRINKHLEDVLSNFSFKDNHAFTLRNSLVHGEVGTVKLEFGKEKVEEILVAIKELHNFSITYKDPISRRRITRRKPRGKIDAT